MMFKLVSISLLFSLIYFNSDTLSVKSISSDPVSLEALKKLMKRSEDYNPNCSLGEIRRSLLRKFHINEIKEFKKYSPLIAVIDTGIDINNEELKKSIYIPKKLKEISNSNYGLDTSNSSIGTQPIDTHGHGSHVIGLILAINPNARILPIKYYNPSLTNDKIASNFNRAIELAIDNNVDIINISGGGAQPSFKEEYLINKAKRKGILVVSALGNEKSNVNENPYYPAHYKINNILNVMSHDDSVSKSIFSNWGSTADISTYGNRIASFGVNGGIGCVFLNGTSQSTAIITGFSSLLLSSSPGMDYLSIKDLIKKYSKKSDKHDLANSFDFYSFLTNIKD